jgi:hypothetical protein
MSQKSSVPQAVSFVSQVLKRDSRPLVRRRALTAAAALAGFRASGHCSVSLRPLPKGVLGECNRSLDSLPSPRLR